MLLSVAPGPIPLPPTILDFLPKFGFLGSERERETEIHQLPRDPSPYDLPLAPKVLMTCRMQVPFQPPLPIASPSRGPLSPSCFLLPGVDHPDQDVSMH